MGEPEVGDRAEKIALYKTLLRGVIDRRPSGLRGRLAMALGKHKSFVSQITNPSYSVPIPAADLPMIFEICHFAAEERAAFMAAYRAAHPRHSEGAPPDAAAESGRVVRIRVPELGDPRLQRELEQTIRQTASRIVALVTVIRSG